jgi:hypothetical protein
MVQIEPFAVEQVRIPRNLPKLPPSSPTPTLTFTLIVDGRVRDQDDVQHRRDLLRIHLD